MKINPYMLVFGKEPAEYISRFTQLEEVKEGFLNEPSTQQVYMITGLRGSGKTVFMTEISKSLSEEGFICVDLNATGDLLSDFLAALASEDRLARIFKSASINLSFFGVGLEVKGSVPITNTLVALEKMLESMEKHKKRVLVCIDEVSVTPSMIAFVGAFQILLRRNLPVYLLMTGLYENINNLQNEDSLTFLYRAPKIQLRPLNIATIAESYQKTLRLDESTALSMAKLTRGYSFAFQVLGYFTWRHKGDYQAALPEFRQYLEEYVYDKIWSEMSQGDRRLAYGVAKIETGKAKDIRTFLNMADREYSPYRMRLTRRGILDGETHGYVKFTLPLFEAYVIRQYEDGF